MDIPTLVTWVESVAAKGWTFDCSNIEIRTNHTNFQINTTISQLTLFKHAGFFSLKVFKV
jgi:hypothetical protein